MSFPIIVTSAGRRVALMRIIAESAKELGARPRIVVTEMNPAGSSAGHLADVAYHVSRCTAPGYPDELLRIVKAESARLIVPTIDTELPALAALKPALEAAGARVAISSPEVVGLARDKILFSAFCEGLGVVVPRTVSATAFYAGNHDLKFPLIFKPLAGSRSIGILRAKTPAEVPVLAKPADYMVQELWTGREFTVNLFVGKDGLLKCAIPHERLEVRDGEVAKGATRRIPVILEAAAKLGAGLGRSGAYGPLCFQGILREDGAFAVFELNARFGGGYPLAHDAGATFARWLIEDALGAPSSARDEWKENRLMLRYDAAVFADER